MEEALSRLPVVPRAVARRLLLDAQGLLDDPTRGCTPARLYRTVERMGFVQIDSINVVARAHHLTLASRYDHYRPAALAHLLENTRVLFEHWTHDAAAIPTRWFPHWHHRFAIQRRRIEQSRWWRERLGARRASLLARVGAAHPRRGSAAREGLPRSASRAEARGMVGLESREGRARIPLAHRPARRRAPRRLPEGLRPD